MNLRNVIFASASLMLAGAMLFTSPISAKKKKVVLPKVELTGAAKDSADFQKKIKDAKVARGMFNTYSDPKGKLFVEIPDSAFGKTYMLVNRINSLSQTSDWVAGQMVGSYLIKFTKDDNNVYLHLPESVNVVPEGDPIQASYDLNFADPVLKAFKIENKRNGSVFIFTN